MSEKTALLICLILLSVTHLTFSQEKGKRETRAVWISTNHRLDWPPPTFDEDVQKESLVQIFSDVRKKNFNVVYFQVRSNGTVIYPSKQEPFSPYFKGGTDMFPSYDPLNFAVRTAHKLGLEIHAWFNTVRCFSGGDNEILDSPSHLLKKHKNWVVKYRSDDGMSYWLDPGLPEVRNYVVDLLKELVENYDIDGINLDYLRYPGKDFDDSFSYSIYGKGKRKDEWRRENIFKLMKQIYTELKRLNPFLKIGFSPIGISKNKRGEYFFSGFSDVFQDSYSFLKNKIADYASPQIYWALDDSPSFESVAKDWREHSYGRNIVFGIALYKPEVRKELKGILQTARLQNPAGIAFFRYSYLKETEFKGFGTFLFPAKMSWIKTPSIVPPTKFTYFTISDDPFKLRLSWEAPSNSSVVKYYALYSDKNLITILPSSKRNFVLSIIKPNRTEYKFTVTALDKLWNESRGISITVENEKLKRIVKLHTERHSPLLFKFQNRCALIFDSSEIDTLEITAGTDTIGSYVIQRGRNIIEFDNPFRNEILLKTKKARGKYLLNMD